MKTCVIQHSSGRKKLAVADDFKIPDWFHGPDLFVFEGVRETWATLGFYIHSVQVK